MLYPLTSHSLAESLCRDNYQLFGINSNRQAKTNSHDSELLGMLKQEPPKKTLAIFLIFSS